MKTIHKGICMITINNLEVKYGNFTALTVKQPLSIESDDKIGIIGSNGAGKTTLLKALLGLVKYDGSITSELRPQEIAAHMQENNYVNTMPVKYIIQMILNTTIEKNEKLKNLISFFEFESCLKKKFNNLSGGQKQRLTIIMVLMQESPLTFFDEVSSGLDFETRQKLMGKIAEWYREKKSAICVVSHYYDELEALVDKLMIIEKGHIVAFGKTEDLFAYYCGNSIMIIDNNEKNIELTEDVPQIEAPSHLLAFPCKDAAYESTLADWFSQHNVNYKRSNDDIEIIFVNAVNRFNDGGETYAI